MKFSQAIEQLKLGNKVTRYPWIDNLYFVMGDKGIQAYQPILKVYNFDEKIMASEGWKVEGIDLDSDGGFHEIVPFLQQGFRVKLKDWINTYIYLDKQANTLVIHSMDVFPFTPSFNDFIAEDWMVLE